MTKWIGECATCGAEHGEACILRSGRVMRSAHARRNLAKLGEPENADGDWEAKCDRLYRQPVRDEPMFRERKAA